MPFVNGVLTLGMTPPAPCLLLASPSQIVTTECRAALTKPPGRIGKLMSDEGVHSQNTVDVAKEPCLQSEGVVGCGLAFGWQACRQWIGQMPLSLYLILLAKALPGQSGESRKAASCHYVHLPTLTIRIWACARHALQIPVACTNLC